MIQDIFGIRTRVYTVQKAWDLSCALMRAGAEGVQNDSSRYNDIMIINAFESGYCWIGLCGGCLRVISVHDTKGKKYLLDVSESKFIEALNLMVIKIRLPKSLRNYNKRIFDN